MVQVQVKDVLALQLFEVEPGTFSPPLNPKRHEHTIFIDQDVDTFEICLDAGGAQLNVNGQQFSGDQERMMIDAPVILNTFDIDLTSADGRQQRHYTSLNECSINQRETF